jgi:LPXTG-motif cell wall-anchored protein
LNKQVEPYYYLYLVKKTETKKSEDSGDKTGMIVGIVLGIIGFFIIIGILAFFYIRSKKSVVVESL